MAEQGHPAKPSKSPSFDVTGALPIAAAVGVVVGFIVGGYVLDLQPVPVGYLLIGGIAGGLLGTIWVMISPYAPNEVECYRSSWCAVWGRAAGILFWGSLCTGVFYIFYSALWGYTRTPPFLMVIWFGSATVYYASLKRNWELAFLFGGGTCFALLLAVAGKVEFLSQHRILFVVLSLLPILVGTGLCLWARRRTARQSSATTEVGHEGGEQPQDL